MNQYISELPDHNDEQPNNNQILVDIRAIKVSSFYSVEDLNRTLNVHQSDGGPGTQNLFIGDSQQILIIFRDISVEKELQRERAMQQYSEIMFASVSHELRTPINIIKNCIACLVARADESQKKWLDIASTSASFLLSLVNDTLVSLSTNFF